MGCLWSQSWFESKNKRIRQDKEIPNRSRQRNDSLTSQQHHSVIEMNGTEEFRTVNLGMDDVVSCRTRKYKIERFECLVIEKSIDINFQLKLSSNTTKEKFIFDFLSNSLLSQAIAFSVLDSSTFIQAILIL